MIPDAPLASRRLAGYRVLRSLARDDDADVLLGFRDAGDDAPTTVALKVVPATPERWSRLLPVIDALERSRGDHVVDLLDVDLDAGEHGSESICLVFERLPRGSLADLVAVRERFEAGEVVTILAPLAGALLRMHAAGAAHGAVGVSTVLFRDDGAPVLIGFGSAEVFASGAPEVVLERQPAVDADRRAARELACQLLARVSGTRARAARVLATELESSPHELVLGLLTTRLFALASAVPVRFTADEPELARGAVRVVPLGDPVADPEGAGATRLLPWGSPWLHGGIPDAWVERVLDAIDTSPAAPILAAAARRWSTWSSRRRRALIGVAAGALALSGALAIVPTAPGDAALAARGSSATKSAVASAAASDSSTSKNAPTASTDPFDADPLDTDPLDTDDPLAAATALAAARDRCISSLSLLCLDGVEQQDSSALRGDRETVRAAQAGAEPPAPLVQAGSAAVPELVERLGDSALVRLGSERNPASLLLVKGETGWRIRDVIAAPANAAG